LSLSLFTETELHLCPYPLTAKKTMDKMIIVDLNIFIAVNVSIACCQRLRLAAGGEIEFLLPEPLPNL